MTCCHSTRFASSSAYRRRTGARCCGPACSRSVGTWRPSKRGYAATAAKRCRHSGRSMNRMRGYVFPAHPRYVDGTRGDHVHVHAAGDGVRGTYADTGPADGGCRAADHADGGTAYGRYRRCIAAVGCLAFHWYLKDRLRIQDRAMLGETREPAGSYDGDGIPRTAGGHTYEPLSWNEVGNRGTD